jgi:hypothetical protein
MSISFVRYLPGNKANERPTHVLFADVESKLTKAKKGKTLFTPFLWTMIYKRYRRGERTDQTTSYWGTSIDAFWDEVENHAKERCKLYLVTHHLEVDFLPMQGFKQLMTRGWRLDKLISHNRILIMWWARDTKKLIVMNNGNLFTGSIEGWGKTFGVSKLEMPDEKAPLPDWVTYCMRDTEILSMMWDFLLDFMDEHDLGNFRLTAAGLAMGAFRHRFMSQKIMIHNHAQVVKLERESYRGGRFEALKIGSFRGETFYNLDINSMYGYIEQEYPLPYELRGYTDHPKPGELEKRIKKWMVIADVVIDCLLPIFPHKKDGKNVYEPGLFETVLSTPELILCIDNGWIKQVISIAWYRGEHVLKAYADYFLDLKDRYDREGNKALRQFAKLYLNSLYGKFGQHGYDDRVIGDCAPDEFSIVEGWSVDTQQRYTITRYGGKIHQTVVTDVGYNTMVAIASHITAYGRLLLWDLIDQAGYNNVYHVATDSLIVNQVGYDRLQGKIDEHIPGMLKLETTFTDFTVKRVNDTIQGGIVKVKGIPKKAKQIDDDTYEVTQWPRMTTLIKAGEQDAYYTRSVIKHLDRSAYHATSGTTDQPDIDKSGTN